VSMIMETAVERVIEALKEPVYAGGSEVTVTGSVGVAIFPDDTTDEVLLRRLADQRMYQQKRQIPLAQEDAEIVGCAGD
jgi:GGDEF domain-containing protein